MQGCQELEGYSTYLRLAGGTEVQHSMLTCSRLIWRVVNPAISCWSFLSGVPMPPTANSAQACRWAETPTSCSLSLCLPSLKAAAGYQWLVAFGFSAPTLRCKMSSQSCTVLLPTINCTTTSQFKPRLILIDDAITVSKKRSWVFHQGKPKTVSMITFDVSPYQTCINESTSVQDVSIVFVDSYFLAFSTTYTHSRKRSTMAIFGTGIPIMEF